MSTKITAPFAFTGETTVGAVSLDFKNGVATFDGTLSNEARRRLHAHGYGVEGQIDPGFGEPHTPIITTEDESGAPAKSDTKAAWVDYGVSLGHARGSLEELTKAEIQSVLEG